MWEGPASTAYRAAGRRPPRARPARVTAMLATRSLLLAGTLLSLAGLSTPAVAAAPETVIQDDAVFLHRPEAEIRTSLEQSRAMGITRLRLTAGWSVIAPKPDDAKRPDFDATDPAAYPPGNWANLDRAVRLAGEAGMRTMIDIAFWAPRWATGEDAAATNRLRKNVDPAEFALFARAVARRYSGGYTPPAPAAGAPAKPEAGPDANLLHKLFGRPAQPEQAPPAAPATPLPGVDIFTIWNEPNHPGFLQPQWERVDGRWVARSPEIYRAMVRAAYPVVKAEAPGSRVLIGGTASMGATEPGKSGIPPMRFLRELACVDERFAPVTTGSCAGFTTLPGDGWAHHPYSLRTLPDRLPRDPDKLPVAATGRLAKALRTLVAGGRLARGNRDLYLTEYGYETGPPDPQAPFRPEQQAHLLAWAEFLGTRERSVRMWPQFLLRDRPGDPAGPRQRAYGDWQSGLLYDDGSPKPAAASFRTPVFAQCAGKRTTMVWARLRDGAAAHARIEVGTAARWRAASTAGKPTANAAKAARVAVRAGGHELRRYVRVPRGASVRVTWTTADGTQTSGPAVTPVGCASKRPEKAR